MASRKFNGTTDRLETYIGGCTFAFGPGTFACIAKKTADGSYQTFLAQFDYAGTGGDSGFQVDTSNNLIFSGDAGDSLSGVPFTVANNWCLIAMTKDTGDVVCRGHKYVYDTGVWTHTNSGNTVDDSAAPISPINHVTLGGYGGGDIYSGHMLIAAMWNRVLSDSELEGMTGSLVQWVQTYPKGLWVLNQASISTPVEDTTGNGANQVSLTGTTISAVADPPFSILGVPSLKRKFKAVQGG